MGGVEFIGAADGLVAWLQDPRYWGRILIPALVFGSCVWTMMRTFIPAVAMAFVMASLALLMTAAQPGVDGGGAETWVMEGLLGAAWTWVLVLPILAVHWCGGIVDSAFAGMGGVPLGVEQGRVAWLLGVITLALFFSLGGHLHFYRSWAALWMASPLELIDPARRVDAIGLALIRSFEDGLLFALILSLATLVSGGWILLTLCFVGRVNPMLSLSLRQTALVGGAMIGTMSLALGLMMDVWSGAYREAQDAAETLVREVLP